MWYIYKVEYCIAMKMNEQLLQVTTWMNLTTLNKRSQTLKNTLFNLYKS